MRKKTYFKGLDASLQGLNDYQYEVGKTYTTDDPDDWHWLFFTEHIETAVRYGSTVVEVEPISKILTNFGKNDLRARSIRIVRIVPLEEVLARLMLRVRRKKDARFYLRKLNMLFED